MLKCKCPVYKTSHIVYNMRNFTTPRTMHIKRHLYFNFSARFQRKVCFTENGVIGSRNVYNLSIDFTFRVC